MYPFDTRPRWLLASRYAHFTAAFERRGSRLQDTLVAERFQSLRRWSRVRTVVTVFLSLGIAAAVVTYAGHLLTVLAPASDLLRSLATYASAFTGAFTLAFLFLTRLLSQIEADILTLLLLERRHTHHE